MDILNNLLGRQPMQRPAQPNSFGLYWSRAGILLVGNDRCGRPIRRTIIPLSKAKEIDARLVDLRFNSRFDLRTGRSDIGWEGTDSLTGAHVVFSAGVAVAMRLDFEERPQREPYSGFGDPNDLLGDEPTSVPAVVTVDDLPA